MSGVMWWWGEPLAPWKGKTPKLHILSGSAQFIGKEPEDCQIWAKIGAFRNSGPCATISQSATPMLRIIKSSNWLQSCVKKFVIAIDNLYKKWVLGAGEHWDTVPSYGNAISLSSRLISRSPQYRIKRRKVCRWFKLFGECQLQYLSLMQ